MSYWEVEYANVIHQYRITLIALLSSGINMEPYRTADYSTADYRRGVRYQDSRMGPVTGFHKAASRNYRYYQRLLILRLYLELFCYSFAASVKLLLR